MCQKVCQVVINIDCLLVFSGPSSALLSALPLHDHLPVPTVKPVPADVGTVLPKWSPLHGRQPLIL